VIVTEPLRLVVQLAASARFGSNTTNKAVTAATFLNFNFGRFLGSTTQTRPTNFVNPLSWFAIRVMLSRSIAMYIRDTITDRCVLSAISWAASSASVFLEKYLSTPESM